MPIRAEAHWLACTDKICVPEQGELALDLPVGTGTPNRAQFDEWRRALPQPLATSAHFQLAGDKLRVAIPLPRERRVGKPYLFPITDGVVDYEAPQTFRRAGDCADRRTCQRKRRAARQFRGVLRFGDGRGLEFRACRGIGPEGGTLIGEAGANAILWAVLGAIVGGMLLNLMPCVFPILALKALHCREGRRGVAARRARTPWPTRRARWSAPARSASLCLLVRAAGAQRAGHSSCRIRGRSCLLLLLAIAITRTCCGLFELPVRGGAAHPAGSFGTGALAAFVATPCAGPFLAAALGTALLLPAAGRC